MGLARLLLTSVTAFAACLAFAASARAAHPNVRLEVVRSADTSSCMSDRALAASVERRLGRRVFDASAPAELAVRVVWSDGGRWTADVALSDSLGPLGKRELSTEARHCSAMDDSLALVVALLVDTPPARVEAPEPEPTSSPVSAPPSVAPPPRDPRASTPIAVPAETLAPREPYAFDARAAAVATLSMLPGFAAGVGVAFGARPPRGPWLRVVGELYFARERALGGGEAVRFSAQRVGIDLCAFDTPLGPLRGELCAGQRTGRVGVTAVGFEQNRSTGRLTHGAVLGGHLALPLGAVGGFFGLRAEIPFTRDQYTVRSDGVNSREVHRAPTVGFTSELGVRYEL